MLNTRRVLSFLLVIFLSMQISYSAITGGVEKSGSDSSNRVIDSKTKSPVPNARITIPQLRYSTKTDNDGRFFLDAQVHGPNILGVEKDGYRPYSLTIDDATLGKPLQLSIEKTTPKDITLETDLIHIGDDNYSDSSAHAGEFRAKAVGTYYSKSFTLKPLATNESAYLVVGSVIGIDTLLAVQLGQSHARNAYASPPEIYFNGQKLTELKCNGDGFKIKLPPSLIRANQPNEITLRCGKNLFQRAYTDYDDIEFMNLSIEVEQD